MYNPGCLFTLLTITIAVPCFYIDIISFAIFKFFLWVEQLFRISLCLTLSGSSSSIFNLYHWKQHQLQMQITNRFLVMFLRSIFLAECGTATQESRFLGGRGRRIMSFKTAWIENKSQWAQLSWELSISWSLILLSKYLLN